MRIVTGGPQHGHTDGNKNSLSTEAQIESTYDAHHNTSLHSPPQWYDTACEFGYLFHSIHNRHGLQAGVLYRNRLSSLHAPNCPSVREEPISSCNADGGCETGKKRGDVVEKAEKRAPMSLSTSLFPLRRWIYSASPTARAGHRC